MKKITKVFIYIWLFLLAAVICFPVVFAVSGVFMQQWELEEYLAPVLGSMEGMARWAVLPHAPTLQSLVELLMDSPQFFVMFWNSLKLSFCIWSADRLGSGQIFFSGEKNYPDAVHCFDADAVSGADDAGISGAEPDRTSGYPCGGDTSGCVFYFSGVYYVSVFLRDSGSYFGSGTD